MSARQSNPLTVGGVFGGVKRVAAAAVFAVMVAWPAVAKPPAPQDVLVPVSLRDEVRQLPFGFGPSERVFFTNVTFAIRGSELMIGQRDRHCPDGSVEFADWTEDGDLIVEDTNNLPRPVEIVAGSARFEIDGFTLAEMADGTTVVTSLRGRNASGEPFDWTQSDARDWCILAITGNCNSTFCSSNCVIDAAGCDKCDCPHWFPQFCTDGSAEWACVDNGCAGGGWVCRFDADRCICVCEKVTGTAGACCYQGTCTDGVSISDCIGPDPENPEGMFFGDGSLCENVECPVYTTGACCILSGEICAETSAEECAELNGVYHGDETSCDPDPCAYGEPGPYFYIGTETDWFAAMDKIEGMTQVEWDDYMDAWADPEEGEPYIENTFADPTLYVHTGGPGQEEYPKGTGLTMVWDPPVEPPGCCQCSWPMPPAPMCIPAFSLFECGLWAVDMGCDEWMWYEDQVCRSPYCEDPGPVSSSSAWKYALGSTHEGRQPAPVDMSNKLVTVTVHAPQFDPLTGSQINVVSFGFQDVNGFFRAWYWNLPATIPWSVPPLWIGTTITINTSMTGVGAATPTADAYMDSGFTITQAQYIIVDENANWIGGGTPIPPPGGLSGAWNYWYNLSVAPNGGGGGPSTHGPVSFSVNGPVDPYYEGLPVPGAGLFNQPWWPPPPPGAGPYPSARTLGVPQAVGIATVQPGDVNDYLVFGVSSEAEIFQSEPWLSPAGPPNGTNNQILQALALGLRNGRWWGSIVDNVNAYTFGEDFFNGDEDPQWDDPDWDEVWDELWEIRSMFPGFVEPVVAGGGLPITFYFSVDPWAIGLPGTAVQNEATWQGALWLPVGPLGSADVGGGAGPWQSDGEASGDVFFASPITAPAVNFLDHDDAPMALLAPRVLVNMEDDLDAMEHVGTNSGFEPGNTHDRVWATLGFFNGSAPPCPGNPLNANHDPTADYPIIFSVDRGSYGAPGSAVEAQVQSQFEGASGDLFIAVTLPPPSNQPTNMLLIDEGQLGLMPHDDLDAVIVQLLITDPWDLVMRIEEAASNFNPDGESEGYGFTLPLLGPGEAVVGFSVDLGSIGLLFSAVDFECRVDGTGVWPGASGVMEHAGDIFFSDLNPPPAQMANDQGTGLLFGQNYLWFEELALGLDRGAWTFTPPGPSGNLDDVPDELNALDSEEFVEDEACCFLEDLACVDLMPAVCLAQFGVPQGTGTQCTAPDACCLPDGTCVNIDPLCCDDLGGIAQDPGTQCTQPEACCLVTADPVTCMDVDPLCCDELGGIPQGAGTQCTQPEACCLDDGLGTCIMVDPLCCDDLGGVAQGPGTMCTAPAACCLQGGGCINVDPLCCDEMGGGASPIGAPLCMGDLNGNGIDDACECGWEPGDPHKMHYPQLPDEDGWDVNATKPLVLADDWRCSQTGWVKDIHFWGSWKDDIVGEIDYFVLSIHADIPASPPDIPYSRPGITLWEREIRSFIPTPIDSPTPEGWYDPSTGEVLYGNHMSYFRYDVCLNEADWFWQEAGIIYWLNISAVLVDDPTLAQWGWKSTEDHWNDDAVWALWDELIWIDLWEPPELLSDWFWVEVDMGGLVVAGGGSGWPYEPDGMWYYYPTGWWNQWFYDHPYDPLGMKTVHIDLCVYRWNPDVAGQLIVAVNWSTPEWSLEGNPPGQPRVPPLPELVGENEELYIGRAELLNVPVYEGTECYPLDFVIPDYNPEWVSIDVMGWNFIIPDAFIVHECTGSLDLAFVITGGEMIGACCYPDIHGYNSLCIVTTQDDCENNLMGIYEGDDTLCWGMEACCLTDGTCIDADALCCVNELGGNPQGPGTGCTQVEACCFPDDTCQNLDPLCCDDLGGTPQGAGTQCGGMEACCLPGRGTGCVDADALCCVNQLSGTPQGQGTACSPDEACCLPSGACIDIDPICCDDIGGVAQGPGTVCTQPEACCLDDDTCVMVDPLCCDDLVGTAYPGEVCEGMEACCLPIGKGTGCVDADALCCVNELGGAPQGPGTACQPDQACCLPGGACMDLDPLCCDDEGGVAQGPFTECTVPEACCLANGDCIEVDPLCCDDIGGVPQGPGTGCTTPEACCIGLTGECRMLDPLCCDEQGGVAQGDDTECTAVETCCLKDGSCINVDPLCCDEMGGSHSPTGVPLCMGDANGDGLDDACEPEGLKWVRMPDLTEIGVDVNATFDPGGSGPITLADDFWCDESGRITEVRVWGSWWGDPDIDHGNVAFTLSFHTNIEGPPSMPGEPIWWWTFEPGTFYFERYYEGVPEYWFNPPEDCEWPGDSEVWMYTFPMPEDLPFIQEEGNIYWLDVHAMPYEEAFFGWKTTPPEYHWMDDAVWGIGEEPFVGPWNPLFYPFMCEPPHPFEGVTLDLAFMLIQEPGAPVKRPLAEDCASIDPGTRCDVEGGAIPCVDDDDCAGESHCVPAPADQPGLGNVCYAPKTRYLSIARNPEQAPDTARRVKLQDGYCEDDPILRCVTDQDCENAGAMGPCVPDDVVLGWVNTPYEAAGLWLANIVAYPVSVQTWPDVVHVWGCEIAHACLSNVTEQHCNPNPIVDETCVQHCYIVQSISDAGDPDNEDEYSEELMLCTNSYWGDMCSVGAGGLRTPPDAVYNLADILAAIGYYQGDTGIAPVTWLDIAPSFGTGIPDQNVGVADVSGFVSGFQGSPYPGVGPKNCP